MKFYTGSRHRERTAQPGADFINLLEKLTVLIFNKQRKILLKNNKKVTSLNYTMEKEGKSFRIASPLFHLIWNNIVGSNLPQWYIPFCKKKWVKRWWRHTESYPEGVHILVTGAPLNFCLAKKFVSQYFLLYYRALQWMCCGGLDFSFSIG